MEIAVIYNIGSKNSNAGNHMQVHFPHKICNWIRLNLKINLTIFLHRNSVFWGTTVFSTGETVIFSTFYEKTRSTNLKQNLINF